MNDDDQYPRRRDDGDDDDSFDDDRERDELPQSGLGMASFAMGLLASFLVVALIFVAGYLHASRPGGVNKNQTMLVGLTIMGGGFVAFIGVVLGIAGLVQRQRRKVFAGLGVAINAFVVLGIVGLMILGLAMQGAGHRP